MHPYLMPLVELEATLLILYASENFDDETRERRADMARAYRDRTGRYFAARFY